MRDPSVYLSEDTLSLFDSFSMGLKRQSQKSYFSTICQICDFTKKDFVDIATKDALKYFQSISHLSKTSISTYFFYLHSFGEYAEKSEMDYQNVFTVLSAFSSPAESFKKSSFPSETEIDALLSAAGSGSDLFLALILSLRMALPVSEIVSLQPKHFVIDPSGQMLLTHEDKSERKVFLTVPEDVQPYLLSRQNNTYLLENSRKKPYLVRSLQAKLANLGMGITFQQIRSLSIYLMMDGGASQMDVAKYTGVSGRWLFRYNELLSKDSIYSAGEYASFRILPPGSGN